MFLCRRCSYVCPCGPFWPLPSLVQGHSPPSPDRGVRKPRQEGRRWQPCNGVSKLDFLRGWKTKTVGEKETSLRVEGQLRFGGGRGTYCSSRKHDEYLVKICTYKSDPLRNGLSSKRPITNGPSSK
jgi:hypothetical protein